MVRSGTSDTRAPANVGWHTCISILTVIVLLFLAGCSSSRNAGTIRRATRVQLTTDSGVAIIRLYDKTPLHRDNFIRLVRQGYFDSLLFHRVIKNFMIQGGDPESRYAKPGALLGNGGPDYTIPAEFDSTLFHKKGVIAAAREGDDINPSKASSASQFYIVQGKIFSDAGLDSVETYRLRGRKIPAWQRQVYKTAGGTPHLDMSYTVFGEVESGLAVIDKIAAAPGDEYDRPLKDIKMKMSILEGRRKINSAGKNRGK